MPLSLDDVLARLQSEENNGARQTIAFCRAQATQDPTDDARLLLQAIEAQGLASLGELGAASRLVDSILPLVCDEQANLDRAARARVEATCLSARGLVLLEQGRGWDAEEVFGRAEGLFRELADPWRTSAMLINRAIAHATEGDPEEGLALIERAADEAADVEVPIRWRLDREVALAINRAGFLFQLHRVDESIAVLVATRTALPDGVDPLYAGRLDFNLADTYLRAHRYGSALEAARSAASWYELAGNRWSDARAHVIEAKALRHLERPHEAEAVIDGVLAQVSAEPDGEEMVCLREAMSALADVYRNTGRGAEADELDALIVGLHAPNPETQALEELALHVNEAIKAITSGRAPERWDGQEEALRLIRDSKRSRLARLFADLFEGLLDAFYEGIEPEPLTRDAASALEAVELNESEWLGLINMALGLRGDKERELRAALSDVANYHERIALQESPGYRAEMLASRGGYSLSSAIAGAVRLEEYAALFELIEWCRQAVPHRADGIEAAMPLASFSRIDSRRPSSADHARIDKPATLEISGRSAMKAVAPTTEVCGEAQILRTALAGPDAAWWTMMRHGQSIAWSLLTPEDVTGGVARVTAELAAALRAHLEGVPAPLESDRELFQSEPPPWALTVVAIARAAAHELIRDPSIVERCLEALPTNVAGSLRCSLSSVDPERPSPYRALGQHLIPEAVRSYIDRYEGRARLLVSVQPELASIPTCLLEVEPGAALIEHSAISYAPPVRLAVELVKRQASDASTGRTLIVSNPTGDLVSYIDASNADVLVDWGRAENDSLVATLENVSAALDRLHRMPGSAAFVFLGHIRAADRRDPATAALVLAPERPYDPSTSLTVRTLIDRRAAIASRVYLGGCEGAGFGTSLEWSSVAAAALNLGATYVVAHRWPIVDGPAASIVDRTLIEIVASSADPSGAMRAKQLEWLRTWRAGGDAPAPHWWAGLQVIGRSEPDVPERSSRIEMTGATTCPAT